MKEAIASGPTSWAMLRRPQTKVRTGLSTSALYDLMSRGLFVRGVKISAKAVAWPGHEVDAINAARLAGKTDDELKALVADLHAKRKAPQ